MLNGKSQIMEHSFRSMQSVTESNTTRTESDSLGSLEVPSNAYFGVQSKRAQTNFQLSGHRIHNQLIRTMGLVKHACTEANIRTGSLSKEIGEAIKKACIEFISGEYDDQIIVEIGRASCRERVCVGV